MGRLRSARAPGTKTARAAAVSLRDPCATAAPWVYAHPSRPQPSEPHYTGKWLIWAHCRQVPAVWDPVRDGTERGVLGVAAKIAGHRRLPTYVRPKDLPDDEIEWAELNPPENRHVVCVYTRDWRDLEDVARVGGTLGQLGDGLRRWAAFEPELKPLLGRLT